MTTAPVSPVRDTDKILISRLEPFAEVTLEDVGIGGYEFWGQRGTQVEWVASHEGETKAELGVTDLPLLQVEYHERLTWQAYADEDEHGNYPCEMIAHLLGIETRDGRTFATYAIEEHC